MIFPRGKINVPDLVSEKERIKTLNRTYGSDFYYPKRADWHGRDCEILGRWADYAAVRFKDHGRHGYEIVKNNEVLDGNE